VLSHRCLRLLSSCVFCAEVISRNRYHADAVPESCRETKEATRKELKGTTTTKSETERKKLAAHHRIAEAIRCRPRYSIQFAERIFLATFSVTLFNPTTAD
jgi:hypothetical protein